MWTRNLITALVLLIVAAGTHAIATTTAVADGNQVRIAMNLPLSGPIAVVTIPYRDGLLMGLNDGAKQYNMPRDVFVTDIGDNAGEPKQAVTIMQRQLLTQFDVYISGVSAQTRAVAPEIDKTSAPHLLYAFDVGFTSGAANRVRILPNFGLEMPIYLGYVKSRGAKRVAVVHINYASQTQFFGEYLVPQLKQAGVEVMEEAYDIGTKDYGTLALKITNFKPDVTIVEGFSFNQLPIINALRTLGYIHDGNLLVGIDFIDLLYNKTPADQIKGVAFASPLVELPEGRKKAADFNAAFKALYKEDPSWPGAYGYDTARVLVAAYAKAKKVSTASIQSVMPFDGLVGKITLDKDNDINSTMGIGLVQDSGDIKAIQ
jgi:ABC-type branched-subunit amino acid transport system substrate-binding protein